MTRLVLTFLVEKDWDSKLKTGAGRLWAVIDSFKILAILLKNLKQKKIIMVAFEKD